MRGLSSQAGKIWWPEYVGRELEFARDVLGIRHKRTGALSMWEGERYMVEALFKHKMVTVRSARGTGKDFACGVIIPTFMFTAPSRVLVLSPTLQHQREILWAEVDKVVKNARVELPCELTTRSLRIDAQHKAIGFPTNGANTVRGPHAGVVVPGDPDADEPSPDDLMYELEHGADPEVRLLIVMDEPQEIDNEVFRELRGMFGKDNVYAMLIGNPMLGMDDEHEYVRSHRDGSRYHRIKFSCCPESDYPDPMSADKVFDRIPNYLVKQRWIDDMKRDHEPDDPIFLSDLLGQFARGSIASLVIRRSILEGALAVSMPKMKLGARMGVDIGVTNDPCVAVCYYDGCKVGRHEWRPEQEDHEAQETIATTIAALSVKWGQELGEKFDDYDGKPIRADHISIDDTGLVGVCDILARKGMQVDRVNFGAGPEGQWPDLVGFVQFKNIRAEMHWVARRGLQEGYFKIPEEFRESWQQAQWCRYSVEKTDKGDRVILEKKDDIKARHRRSPDDWDADILAMREIGSASPFKNADALFDPSYTRNGSRLRRLAESWTEF